MKRKIFKPLLYIIALVLTFATVFISIWIFAFNVMSEKERNGVKDFIFAFSEIIEEPTTEEEPETLNILTTKGMRPPEEPTTEEEPETLDVLIVKGPVVPEEPTTEAPKAVSKSFKLTAYCSCEKCCGQYALNRPNGVVYTASGNEAVSGRTVAVDPNVIPLGSTVVINGKEYIAHDTGAFRGNIIDIYFDNHEDAWNFGAKWTTDVYWY